MSAKARTVAGDLNDPEMKQEMLRIADGYDALAELGFLTQRRAVINMVPR
jgi:hypothetical protein